jgi:hypothetical protein
MRKRKQGGFVRIIIAIILAVLVFSIVFLILSIACNYITAKSVSAVGVYLSTLPAPLAAYVGMRIGRKVLGQTGQKKIPVVCILIPLAIFALVGGFILPELERNVLSAVPGGFRIGAYTSFDLIFVSWGLSIIALFFATKSVVSRS